MTTRSSRISFVFAAAALAAITAPAAGVEPVPLCEAVAKGRAAVEAIAMHGFEKIDLVVANLSGMPQLLDPAGTVLTPPDSALQRLGLGAPVDADPEKEESFFISIPASGRWSGCVWAVCLDFGKGVPPTGVPYRVSPELASGNALDVLKYWAKNPRLDQKTVNDIVWSGQDLGVLKSQVIPARLRKSSIAASEGQLFWLSGDGALLRQKGESWEPIGDGFDSVRAGFGMAVCGHRAVSSVRVFATSQGAWKLLLLPGVPSEILPGPAYSILARVEGALYRFGAGSAEFVSVCPHPVSGVALKHSTSDPELFALESPSGQILALDKGGAWKELPGAKARGISATSTSLYAVMDGGVFRFQRGWKRIADSADSLFAGRTALFYGKGDKLFRYSEADGATIEIPSLKKARIAIAADSMSDSFWALDEGGAVWVLNGAAWNFVIQTPGN